MVQNFYVKQTLSTALTGNNGVPALYHRLNNIHSTFEMVCPRVYIYI